MSIKGERRPRRVVCVREFTTNKKKFKSPYRFVFNSFCLQIPGRQVRSNRVCRDSSVDLGSVTATVPVAWVGQVDIPHGDGPREFLVWTLNQSGMSTYESRLSKDFLFSHD